MSKKLTRKEKIALQQQEPPAKTEAKKIGAPVSSADQTNKTKLSIALIIAVLGFLIYSNSLNYEYTLDDFSLIKENFQTKKGTAALKDIFSTSYRAGYYLPDNDLYRPL